MPPLGARSRKYDQNKLEIESFEEDHNIAGHYLLCRTSKTCLSVQLNRPIQREKNLFPQDENLIGSTQSLLLSYWTKGLENKRRHP